MLWARVKESGSNIPKWFALFQTVLFSSDKGHGCEYFHKLLNLDQLTKITCYISDLHYR